MAKRVLIADDNETMRRVIRSFLEQLPGVEICAQTSNGLETVDTAIALRPDLLILDFMMPGLSGLEVAGVLKKSLPDAKTVLFTMYGDFLNQKLAAAAGINVVLPKTEGLSALSQAVQSLVEVPNPDTLRRAAAAAGARLAAAELQVSLNPQPAFSQETAREEDQERFESTFEQGAVGIGHATRDGHWLRVNHKLCDMLSYTREELQKLTVQDLTHPGDLPKDIAQFRRIAKGETSSFSLEKRYLRKDGALLWVRLTVHAVRNPQGRLKYCVHVLEDIGDLKEVQEKLAQATRAGQTASGLLELLTKRFAAPLTRCSRDFKYLWVNQYYADWLRKPIDKIIGRPILDVLGKQAFQSLHPHFDRVLTGEDVTYEAEADYDTIGLRSIAASYKPTLDRNGIPDGWLALVQDITPKKQ